MSDVEDIQKAIKKVVYRTAQGHGPQDVADAVKELVDIINTQRRLVVFDYLTDLAEEWPEGRERLLAEAKKIADEAKTGETPQKEE